MSTEIGLDGDGGEKDMWKLRPVSESPIWKWVISRPSIKKWRNLPPRTQDMLLKAFGWGVAVGVVISLPWYSKITHVRENFRLRQEEKLRLRPYRDEAQKLRMTYETAQVGKPVEWRIYHPGRGISYLDGRPSQPLEWTNESLVPFTAQRFGDEMVAEVEGRSAKGVVLKYIGEW